MMLRVAARVGAPRAGALRGALQARYCRSDDSTNAAAMQAALQEQQARRARLVRRIICGKDRKRCWLSEAADNAYTGAVRGVRRGLKAVGKGLADTSRAWLAAAERRTSKPTCAAILFAGTTISHVICAPTAPLNLAAGALLGTGLGAAVVVPAMLFGSVVSFLLGQTLLASYADACLSSLDIAAENLNPSDAVYTTWLLRVCVAFPSGIVSYALGGTPFNVYDFAVGTFLGQGITGYLFCHIGHTLRATDPATASLPQRLARRFSVAWAVAVLAGLGVFSLKQLGSLALPVFFDSDEDEKDTDDAASVPAANQVQQEVRALMAQAATSA